MTFLGCRRTITVTSLASVLALAYSSTNHSAVAQDNSDSIHVRRTTIPEPILRYRRSLEKGRPALRGFRAPILENAGLPWPLLPLDSTAPPEARQAADIVGWRLAKDGLLPTLAAVIETIGPTAFAEMDDEAVESLKGIGFPVDLLACFPSPDDPIGPYSVAQHISRRLIAGENAQAMQSDLEAVPFKFTQSRRGFSVATESGEHDLGLLRLQLPTGDYWRGDGDGSSVDIARQLIAKLPEVSFIASIEEKHLDDFLSLARKWPLKKPSRLTVLAEPMPVGQWAQDNGKPGLISTANGVEIATLVPRYASRGEESTIFVPDETFLIDNLAAIGHTAIQSPLIFQGGNLMPVRDPETGERIMLIGEAEIYRNTALGLTRDQVLQAFQIEFGVDRCVVLPAVSFHIDFELCARAQDGRLVVFVNDTLAAARIILSLGMDALENHGTLTADQARQARQHLKTKRDSDFLEIVAGSVLSRTDPNRYFPESLARFFAAGPHDAHASNLQRFLLAMDVLASSVVEEDELPGDPITRAFVVALKRQEADRRALHRQLEELGWKIVGVPSLSNADRSINYLNGIHDRTRYIMPAYGGFYEPLDKAAQAAFARELGPETTVISVLSGESQRSFGAVHCGVAAYPRVP